MSSRVPLARLEEIIGHSGAPPRIEMMLPISVRHRQLTARTLLLGMLLALAGRRPACLTEIRAALTSLPEADQIRLEVIADWKTGPHQAGYRRARRPGCPCRALLRSAGRCARLAGR